MNKDIFSDDVALNIKLSKKAKLKPVGTIEGTFGLVKGESTLSVGRCRNVVHQEVPNYCNRQSRQ